MIHPCFEVKCPHLMRNIRPLHKSRFIKGNFPLQVQPRGAVYGRESWCKECWAALPPEEQHEGVEVQVELRKQNYSHFKKDK